MAAVQPIRVGRRLSIIDDDPDARIAYVDTVSDADFVPIDWTDKLTNSIEDECKKIASKCDAVLTDYEMRQRGYSSFTGAALAAELYKWKIPTILCTRYDHTSAPDIRRFRGSIPVLINPRYLDTDSLSKGIEYARRELAGDISATRRSWRTLIRVESVERNTGGRPCTVYLVIPAWDPSEVIEVDGAILSPLRDPDFKVGLRFHAQVNIGADEVQDIYIKAVEPM